MEERGMLHSRKNYINASVAAFVVLMVILINDIGLPLLIAVPLLENIELANSFAVNFLLNLLLQLVFLGATLIILRKYRLVYSPLPKDRSRSRLKSTAITCSIAILLTLASLVLFYPAAIQFDFLLRFMGYNSSDLFSFDGTLETISIIFLTVIAAPICEELIFRGILLSGMKKSGYSDIKCVLLSGISFSLMHCNPDQTIYQFCLGCALAFITLRTKSLLPAIVGHAANNGIAILLTIFNLPSVEIALTWMFFNTVLAVIVPIVYLAIGVLVVFYLGKLSKRIVVKYHTEKEFEIIDDEIEYLKQQANNPIFSRTGNNYYGYGYNHPYGYGQPIGNYQQFGQPQNQQYGQPYSYGQPQNQQYGQTYQQSGQSTQRNTDQSITQQQQQHADYSSIQQQQQQQQQQQPLPQYQQYMTYYNQPYGYGWQGMMQPRSKFKLYYILSVAICGIMWLLVLTAGMITTV